MPRSDPASLDTPSRSISLGPGTVLTSIALVSLVALVTYALFDDESGLHPSRLWTTGTAAALIIGIVLGVAERIHRRLSAIESRHNAVDDRTVDIARHPVERRLERVYVGTAQLPCQHGAADREVALMEGFELGARVVDLDRRRLRGADSPPTHDLR